jgi:hypothetical protein
LQENTWNSFCWNSVCTYDYVMLACMLSLSWKMLQLILLEEEEDSTNWDCHIPR